MANLYREARQNLIEKLFDENLSDLRITHAKQLTKIKSGKYRFTVQAIGENEVYLQMSGRKTDYDVETILENIKDFDDKIMFFFQ